MAEQSVKEWLATIELQHYSDLFSKAGLRKLSQCYSLDEKALCDIGITLLGHRKRILERLPSDIYEVPPPRQGRPPDLDSTVPPLLPIKTVIKTFPKQESPKPRPVPAPRGTRKNVTRQEHIKEDEIIIKDNPHKKDVGRPVPKPRPRPSLNSSSQSGSTESMTPVPVVLGETTSDMQNPLSALQIVEGTALDWSSNKTPVSGSSFIEQTPNPVSTVWGDEEEDIYEPIWMGKPKTNKELISTNEKILVDEKKKDFDLGIQFSPFRASTISGQDQTLNTIIPSSDNTESLPMNNFNPFSLPPPTFPPPPLPGNSIRDDIKEFDPFMQDSPDVKSFPPVPPRPSEESNMLPGSQTTSTPQRTSRPQSYCASRLPNQHIPFMDDSFDLGRNVYSPNTHPSLQNVPSFVGEDPFGNEADPFNDFDNECKHFNEGIKVAPCNDHIYVNEQNMEREDIYVNENKKRSYDFRGTKRMYCHWHMFHHRCVTPEDDSSSFYEVARPGFGDSSSYDDSGNEIDDQLYPTCPTVPLDNVSSIDFGTRKSERCNYLWKQGGQSANKGWRKRWVVFNGNDLRYYNNNRSQVSKRIIPLSCMNEVINDVKDGQKSQFKFRLVTKTRTFLFASDDRDDCALWCQVLMEAIITYQKPEGGLKPGGDMCNPDKEGIIRFHERRNPYYVAIKGAKLCYYDSEQDFKIASPVNEIEMKLASVKSVTKVKLQLSTNYGFFQLESHSPSQIIRLWNPIPQDFLRHLILDQIMENPSNQQCGDCSASNPHWAAIDKGIVLCKLCAGIHRDFNPNRVKSLRMDTRVWSPSLIEMMRLIGNRNANNFWCGKMPPNEKITEETESQIRKQHIENKYLRRKYRLLHSLAANERQMNELLLQTVETDDVLLTMKLVFSGANIHENLIGFKTFSAFQIAKQKGQQVQVEFLYQNGGDKQIGALSASDECLYNRRRYEVCKRGTLMKTGSNMKDFLKRYCVLEHASLSYYSSDKSNIANDSIESDHILFLQARQIERYPDSFEISSCKNNNRIYLFSAPSSEQRVEWMQAISKIFCPVDIMDKISLYIFSLAGICYFKDGVTMEWHKSWLMLNNRNLMVLDKTNTEAIEQLIAKNLTSFVGNPEEASCQQCIDKAGPYFILDVPNRALYLQADLARDTEKLFTQISDAINISGQTLEEQLLTSEDVPVIVQKCIEFIELYGVHEEGIYRKAGTESQTRNLLERFRKDAQSVVLKPGEVSVHDVANVLKRFFRELSEPIVTKNQYERWIKTSVRRDTQNKLYSYRALLNDPDFPKVNFSTIKKLAKHLSILADNSEQNKMSKQNISLAFGPTLMGQNDSSTASLTSQIWVIGDLIEYRERLFEVDATEKTVESNIKAYSSKIKQLAKSQVCDHTLVDIYHPHFTSELSHRVQVYEGTKVSDVIEDMKMHLRVNGGWALYEVIKSGAIVRPLNPKVVVNDVMGEWASWGEDHRKTVRFCLISDETLQILLNSFKPGRPLFAEMDFRDRREKKKKTKKFLFDFKQAKLQRYKKPSSPLDSWNVEDFEVYIGTDYERPPTGWAISFLVRGDKAVSTEVSSFGYTVWCPSEEEQFNWLSAMFKAQHSDWLS
ncbi:hypothetical protein ScPMuIL_011606 [Solemya velum]